MAKKDPVKLEPDYEVVEIDGKVFTLREPMADKFADYSELQQKLADEFTSVSTKIGTLAQAAIAKELQDEATMTAVRDEIKASRDSVDNSDIVLFILQSDPGNPVIDKEFVQTKITHQMRSRLITLMNRVCGIQEAEKNPISLLFPAVGILLARMGRQTT
jgi:hypothetical protein